MKPRGLIESDAAHAIYGIKRTHAFISQQGAYGNEACFCGWRRDGWDAPTFEDHFISVVMAELRPALARAWDCGELAAIQAAGSVPRGQTYALPDNPFREDDR